MIEESERHHRTNRTLGVRGNIRVFNDKGQTRNEVAKGKRNAKRVTYEIEGILEVQKMLLLKLAGQENRMKGFSQGVTGGKDAQSKADLEQLKVDTAQAVQATWSKGSTTRRAT